VFGLADPPQPRPRSAQLQPERELIAQRAHQAQCPGLQLQRFALCMLGDDEAYDPLLHHQRQEQHRPARTELAVPTRNAVACTAHGQIGDVYVGLLPEGHVEDIFFVGLAEAQRPQTGIHVAAKARPAQGSHPAPPSG